MKRYGGRILITEKAILHWLDLDGGRFHYVGRAEELFDTIVFVIEHPDFPEANEGDILPNVVPIYRELKAERIFPKKHNPLMRLLRKFL